MTDETIDRRTTLKVLGAGGAAALAGAGLMSGQASAYGYTDTDEEWTADEFAPGFWDSPNNDEPGAYHGEIESVVELAGRTGDGRFAGTLRDGDGVTRGFWSEGGLTYVSGIPSAVHDVDGESSRGTHVGELQRDGETHAFVNCMDAAEGFHCLYHVDLPSLGGDFSAAYSIKNPGNDSEMEVLGVSTTPEGEQKLVLWTIQQQTDDGSDSDDGSGDDGSDSDDGSGDDGSDESDGGDGDTQARELLVEGTDEARWASYEVVIDGTAELGDMANSAEEVTQNDDGTVTVSGTVGSGTDSFTFTGSIVSAVDVAGARYLVDGEEYVPDSGSDGSDSDDDSDGSDDTGQIHELRIETNSDGRLVEDYEVVIDGTAELGGQANSTESITNNGDGTVTAEGQVKSGADTFTYTGEIVSIANAAALDIYVDDDWITPEHVAGATLDETDGERKTLRIEGTDATDFANYWLWVEGAAAPRESANSGDRVLWAHDGTVEVTGTVGSGADEFVITGEVTAYTQLDSARYYVDGERIDG